jgi:hypothetical protein
VTHNWTPSTAKSTELKPWHSYRVTIAHHDEVGVSADGPASTPPSGAADASPPPGA